MMRARQRLGRAWRFSFMIVVVSTVLSAAAFAGDMQRMLLAPTGCHLLAPGAYIDASAYCLDQARQRPADGVILSNVPASFDEATVKIPGAAPLTLSQALAERMVEIVGRGSDSVVRLRNLTDRTIEICITGPTVVTGAGEAGMRDIERIHGKIERLLRTPKAPDAAHEAIQQKLWQAVNESDQQERGKLTRDLAPSVVFPSAQKPAPSATGQRKCAGETEKVDVKLCTE
jgi:hypothetical protein